MKGVTILSMTEGIDSIWIIILLILFGIALIVHEIADLNCRYDLKSKAFFVGILSIVSCIIIVIVNGTIPTEKYKYEVTIDDNVSMKEFNEHYEIIEQRGEIYVVKEK